MESLGIDSKPSSSNILRKFYTKVIRLNDYIQQNVSSNRFERITAAAQENNVMKTLLHTALVCINPKFNFLDDEDSSLDEISILSVGEHAAQNEVNTSVVIDYLWQLVNRV